MWTLLVLTSHIRITQFSLQPERCIIDPVIFFHQLTLCLPWTEDGNCLEALALLCFSQCPWSYFCQATLELSTSRGKHYHKVDPKFFACLPRNINFICLHKPGQPLARESRAATSWGHPTHHLIYYITKVLSFSAFPFSSFLLQAVPHTENLLTFSKQQWHHNSDWLKTVKINESEIKASYILH